MSPSNPVTCSIYVLNDHLSIDLFEMSFEIGHKFSKSKHKSTNLEVIAVCPINGGFDVGTLMSFRSDSVNNPYIQLSDPLNT